MKSGIRRRAVSPGRFDVTVCLWRFIFYFLYTCGRIRLTYCVHRKRSIAGVGRTFLDLWPTITTRFPGKKTSRRGGGATVTAATVRKYALGGNEFSVRATAYAHCRTSFSRDIGPQSERDKTSVFVRLIGFDVVTEFRAI